MTTTERAPSPIRLAGRKIQHLCAPHFDRYAGQHVKWMRKPPVRKAVVAASEVRAGDIACEDSKTAARLMKIIALAEEQSAKIIGVTGDRPGVGASIAARQLATAFANFGKKSLLVDASRVDFGRPSDARPQRPNINLLDLSTTVRPDVAYVDLAAEPYWPVSTREQMRDIFDAAASTRMLIVDLPPVFRVAGQPTRGLGAAGAACDLTFLVCLSGMMKRKELSDCVETCKIVGVKLGGLILNDWKLPGNALLEA